MSANQENPSRPDGRPLRKQGEEAIGKLAEGLLQSPVVSGALSTVFETRERATRAQEVAMSALNLPSAADIERLTRRVRSVGLRIEGVEDSLDRVTRKLDGVAGALEGDSSADASGLEARLGEIEAALERIEAELASRAHE